MTKQAPSDVDIVTGEVMEKPYLTSQHVDFPRVILSQYNYVHDTLRNEKDPGAFTRLDGDTLSLMLSELTAYYETVGKWLADEKLHLNDLKLARNFKYNDLYLQYKQRRSETNETARVQAQMLCRNEDDEIHQVQHNFDRVDAWKKAVGRWHDTCRSQLSYEKTLGNSFSR